VLAFALVVTGLAALLHVYVFVLESFWWTGPRAARVFGLDAETARTTAPLAFNQGFYNLFLSVEVLAGTVVLALGHEAVGATLVLVGALSMVAAGLVLLLSDRTKARSALLQIAPAGLGSVLLVTALATS
jgi:putative membrane protein